MSPVIETLLCGAAEPQLKLIRIRGSSRFTDSAKTFLATWRDASVGPLLTRMQLSRSTPQLFLLFRRIYARRCSK
jgi:hypothetical protein